MKRLSPPQNPRAETLCTIIGLLLVTVVLYGHTLHVPFYLDDHAVFNGTHMLRDLPAAVRNLFGQRGLTNLTFAVNYRFAGWSLPPLHLVNIALHVVCGLLFWLVLRRLVGGRWLPLAGALLFVAHPLQTQAVTYLVQRATILGACLFLMAFLFHLRARDALAASQGRCSSSYLRWHVLAVLAGGGAVLAKENTATLPVVLIIYDNLFPRAEGRCRSRLMLQYLPFFVAPLLLGITTLNNSLTTGDGLALHSEVLSLRHNSPLHYLATQFSVMWVYLRLLALPADQALLHNYPVVAELFTVRNALALGGLIGLIWLSWRLRVRRPMLAFGVAWFFLALAVESSVIPLDPLFEHRLYLPMAGFVFVLLDGLPLVLGERPAWAVLFIALAACGPLTWKRNSLWNDPMAFYEENLRVAPDSERVLEYLGMTYGESGDFRSALIYLHRAMKLNPQDASVLTNIGVIHSWMGDNRQALDCFERSLRLAPGSEKTLFNHASTLFSLGDKPEALETLRRLVKLNPDNADAQYGLGSLAFELGSLQEAHIACDALRQLGDERARELDKLLSR